MNTQLYTARLILSPVKGEDIADIISLKTNSVAFSHMLGGIRTIIQAQQEMIEDIIFWGHHKIGIYIIRERFKSDHASFLGIAGIHLRPDGRGYALRFALWPWAQGKGYASEAAYCVLRQAHLMGFKRIIAVTKENNIGSRRILGSIGMQVESQFERHGYRVLVYASEQI